MAHNIALGRRAGLSEEQIDALQSSWRQSDCFTPPERAVLAWAERVTQNTAKNAFRDYEELSAHFTPAEIVEITLAAALFNMINRVKHALHIDAEPADIIAGVTGTLDVDLVAMRDHLTRLLADVERRIAEQDAAGT